MRTARERKMGNEAEVIEEEENADFDDEFNKQAAERDGIKDEIDSPAVEEDESKKDDGEGQGGDEIDSAAEAETDASKEKVDPYAGMDEATKERFVAMEESNKSLLHYKESNDGRVGALQRKINGLEGDIKVIHNTSTKEQPTKSEITEAMAGSNEKWDKFKDDYPEVATAIEGKFDQQNTEIDIKLGKQTNEIKTTLAPVVKKQEDDDMQHAYDAVAEEFPTWQNATATQEFNDWLATQSPGIQDLAESDDVQDASSLIGLYDSHLVANDKPSLRKTDHVETDTVVEDKATSLEQKRAQQLEDGATIPSKSAGISPDSESEGEFVDAFAVFAKRQDAKRLA